MVTASGGEQIRDLDAELSNSQRSELLAFSALVETRLEAATVYTTWVEPHSFSTFTRVCTHNQDMRYAFNSSAQGHPSRISRLVTFRAVCYLVDATLPRAWSLPS